MTSAIRARSHTSRDVIAMATAVALSHAMFDGALYLGVCDKIVPGLLIGALSFDHLPALFVPAGPMPSGMANREKVRIRQLHAEAAGGVALLKALGAPLPQALFCPTGGITPDNARDYLALANVACVGGSWMVRQELMQQQRWDTIRALARVAAQLCQA